MRALRYDGRADRPVKLAAWIAVSRVVDAGEEAVRVACSRCSGEARIAIVAGGKRDAERLLGTFARWHARCASRGESVAEPPEGREDRDPRPASYFEQFRRRRA